MTLSLAEALPLRKQLSNEINRLTREREANAYIEFVKDMEFEEPKRDFEVITEELTKVRNDFREIDFAIDKANVTHIFEFEGSRISLKEAIELSKQMRIETHSLERFGQSKKMTKEVTYGSSVPSYRKALFNPDDLTDKARRLLKLANRLSMDIEKQNHLVSIEFDNASIYL